MKRHLTLLICMMFLCQWMHAEDGSLLWLRQKGTTATSITSNKTTQTTSIAVNELKNAWKGLPVSLIIKKNKSLCKEGFMIEKKDGNIIVSSPTDKGILYGAYHLLRLQASNPDFERFDLYFHISAVPLYTDLFTVRVLFSPTRRSNPLFIQSAIL